MAAGDKLDIEASPSGTPTAGQVHYTTKYVSNTAKHTILLGSSSTSPSTYLSLHGRHDSGTEFFAETVFPISGTLRNLYVEVSTAPGGGNSRTFTVRKNSTSTALTCTIAGAATSCSDLVNTVTIAAGDTAVLQHTPSGSPAAGRVIDGVVLEADTASKFTIAMGSEEPSNTAVTRFYGVSSGDSNQDAVEGERDQLAQAMTIKAMYAEIDVALGQGVVFSIPCGGTAPTQACSARYPEPLPPVTLP